MHLVKKDGTKIPFRCKICGHETLMEKVEAVQYFLVTTLTIEDNDFISAETELSCDVQEPESVFICDECECVIGNTFEEVVKYIEER